MKSPRETVLCQYRYDPLDRLISHALPFTPERQRFYCKSRLASEIQGAMGFSIVQHGDKLLAQQRSEGDAPDSTLLATDQQRSVMQSLKAAHPPQPIAYSPYGHRPVESGLLSLLGFNGERPDPVTGHYLLGNGYRAFNPVLMRFNSPDSLSPFDKGGLNAYVYCLGDPINRHDPNGQYSFFSLVKSLVTRKVTYKSSSYIDQTIVKSANPLKIIKGLKLKDKLKFKTREIEKLKSIERKDRSAQFLKDYEISNAPRADEKEYAPHERFLRSKNGKLILDRLTNQNRTPIELDYLEYEKIKLYRDPLPGIPSFLAHRYLHTLQDIRPPELSLRRSEIRKILDDIETISPGYFFYKIE
ncbi:hypothetical protein PS862_05186 [Pseudomonas fluorescens]|uniref:RHS repeat-associated core domain-containing protein n=1 Tax=Pseudomonas fluorescens TaxID=294 RepID=A0A5E7PDE0_PSEFL|nr:RHS repeat-associated core domain-containing protein [Pseudomonas fluorescens]VVP47030.1 hypothetical protein PS862_05186 [Pseudomonas fluorescens]